MKTRRILFLCVAVALVLFALTGCFVKSKGVISAYTYDSASSYNVGQASVDASKVKNLEVDWIAGSVKVVYGRTRTIEITESPKSGKLSEDEQLRWMVDGNKLKIRFMKSGIKLVDNLSKDLVVTIPEGMVLSEIGIDTVSANSDVTVNAENYDMDNVSGDVTIKVDSVKYFDMDTVSGDADLTFGVCPSKLDMDSVSGNCTVRIPSNSGFTAKISAVSGKIKCSIPGTTSNDRIEVGDGKASFKLSTVSGNLTIESI